MAREKGLTLECEIPDSQSMVKGNRESLLLILKNLIDNAIKFTPPRGRIEIQAQFPSPAARDTGQNSQMIRFSVTDTGSGVADSDKEKIFEKFRQADGSITRETTGSGLGLAISTELAVMLAGSVGMESPPEGRSEGSRFWLDIPVTLPKEKMKEMDV